MYFQDSFVPNPIYVIDKTYDKGGSEPYHQHSCHQLLVVKEGLLKVLMNGKRFIIT